MIKLGDKIRDTVTGFEGIAVCRLEFINGCTQYTLQPASKEKGKIEDAYNIDEAQLKTIGVGVNKKKPAKKKTPGGPSTKVSRTPARRM